MDSEFTTTLQRIYESSLPLRDDLVRVLSSSASEEMQELYAYADRVRAHYMGQGILLRGIVEFSNYCRNTCYYCGLNKNNKELGRYRLTPDEIMDCAEKIAASRVKTIVLQSGEEDDLDAGWLAEVVRQVKAHFDIAVTLSVGEREFSEYKRWKEAGADRYLLKIETSNKKLYDTLHSRMSFERRVGCLHELQRLGYQTGSGSMIGLKGQTLEMIADDIIFFKKMQFEMIGIGPFIPHRMTELAHEPRGGLELTLKCLALTRIVIRTAHLPATTALGSLDKDYRIDGLKAGANVVMPNFTPPAYRKLYEIYPGKKCIDEAQGACVGCMETLAASIGRSIDYSRGDGLR